MLLSEALARAQPHLSVPPDSTAEAISIDALRKYLPFLVLLDRVHLKLDHIVILNLCAHSCGEQSVKVIRTSGYLFFSFVPSHKALLPPHLSLSLTGASGRRFWMLDSTSRLSDKDVGNFVSPKPCHRPHSLHHLVATAYLYLEDSGLGPFHPCPASAHDLLLRSVMGLCHMKNVWNQGL